MREPFKIRMLNKKLVISKKYLINYFGNFIQYRGENE